MDKKIYYKELAHMIMEAGKSEDLQSGLASWRHSILLAVYFQSERLWAWGLGRANIFIWVQRQEKANIPVPRPLGRKNSFYLERLRFLVYS